MRTLTDTWLRLALSLEGEPEQAGVTYDANLLGRNLARMWRSNAYAAVALSDKLAASLVLTKLPDELEDVEWPWPHFLVILPEFIAETMGGLEGYREAGMFLTRNPGGGFSVAHATVAWSGGRWLAGVGMSATYANLSEFCRNTEAEGDSAGKAVARVVVGALCELNSKPEGGCRVGSPPAPNKRSGGPRVWNFLLTRPNIADYRAEAGEFLRGAGSPAALQRLVRGHWQRYHVGPLTGIRRVVLRHKEPYWHGKQDGPIALREHALGMAIE